MLNLSQTLRDDILKEYATKYCALLPQYESVINDVAKKCMTCLDDNKNNTDEDDNGSVILDTSCLCDSITAVTLDEKSEEDIKNTIVRLKKILNGSQSNEIHKIKIMNLPTLKEAHIYCKCNNLSGQVAGPALENYIQTRYKMTKNNSSSCIGDLKWNGINIEIKTSNGGNKHNKFNYVQLRLSHECEYIFTAYYINHKNVENLGELYIFHLNKEQLKQMIVKHGNYAHGTNVKLGEKTVEDLNAINNQKEYAIRPKYGDNCWKDLLQFRIDEIVI